MGKHKIPQRELDSVQKIKEENKNLKKIVKHLRKELARVDLARFDDLKEQLNELDYKEKEAQEKKVNEDKWLCHTCRQDVLRLTVIERRDGVFYQRCCQGCKYRTRLKRYNAEEVKE